MWHLASNGRVSFSLCIRPLCFALPSIHNLLLPWTSLSFFGYLHLSAACYWGFMILCRIARKNLVVYLPMVHYLWTRMPTVLSFWMVLTAPLSSADSLLNCQDAVFKCSDRPGCLHRSLHSLLNLKVTPLSTSRPPIRLCSISVLL